MASFITRLQRRIYRNRSISFSPAGIRFILLTLAVGLAAVNTGNNLLYLILGMMLSLIMVSGILSEQSLRQIWFEWRFPSRLFARQPAPAEMKITNRKRFLPSYSFRIDDGNPDAQPHYIPKLSAGRTVAIPRTATFPKRGLQPLPSITLSTNFPFGFICKSLVRQWPQTVLVYPRILQPPPGIQFTRTHAGWDRENRRRGVGTELHNLREYTPADDARGIHWKASARESRLLLKEFESEDDSRVYLTLSHRAPRHPAVGGQARPSGETFEDFERAVEIAAALAWEFNKRGCAVGLETIVPSGPVYAPTAPSGPSVDNPPHTGTRVRSRSGLRPSLHPESRRTSAPRGLLAIPQDGTRAETEEVRDLDAILQTLALIRPVSDQVESALLQQRIGALMSNAVIGSRRILILPFPDPLWDRYCGNFSDVLVAGEPRFRDWAGATAPAEGLRS
jgi:uncharacterized protein (DUF58 family)